jgi:hypothetical protein
MRDHAPEILSHLGRGFLRDPSLLHHGIEEQHFAIIAIEGMRSGWVAVAMLGSSRFRSDNHVLLFSSSGRHQIAELFQHYATQRPCGVAALLHTIAFERKIVVVAAEGKKNYRAISGSGLASWA